MNKFRCVGTIMFVAVLLSGTIYADESQIEELERRIDVLAEELEKQKIGKAYTKPDESVAGLGPAASKIYAADSGISFGGYGEVKARLNPKGNNDVFDLHRIILYSGYKFNDQWVFNSEIEFEHVKELSVEFAYIDYLARPEIKLRVGHVLVPLGIVNEMHEPTTFWSVDRPEVEKRIIPSTWHENGAGIYGDLGPISYKAYVLSGFDAENFKAQDDGLRSVRQKGAKAKFQHPAAALRLDYTGTNGLLAGVSGFAGNAAQTMAIDAPVFVYDAHVDWSYKGFGLRSVVAFSSIPDAADINTALGYTAADDTVAEFMYGVYVEAGYDVMTVADTNEQSLSPFIRYSKLDTTADVPAGFNKNAARERQILTTGLAYKPIDQITFKIDYKNTNPESGSDSHNINIGAGYIF